MEYLETPNPEGAKRVKGYRGFLLVILFFSFYLSYLILFPFLDTLILAIVMASMFHPLQVYLTRRFRGRNNLAALCIVFIITFVIALPVFFFTTALVSQGLDTVNKANDWLRAGNLVKLTEDPRINEHISWLQERLPFLELNKTKITDDLLSLSKNLGQFLLTKVASILGNVAHLVAQFFIMIFIAFYLVRDGREMVRSARALSPLREDQEDRLLDGINVVAKSVLLGTFLTAVCQGLVAGIAFKLVGFPGLFWGTMAAIASLIPLVGAYLVMVPMALYLVLLGESYSAVFLVGWIVVLGGIIDNVVRPLLMKGKSKMSPFYIFLAILGGVQHFGLQGILYGPLILSFAMIMLYIYGVEYRDELTENKQRVVPPAPEADAR
ncbi:MAG: AI-2E family transporter [Syntrophobacteraceae bacterium]